MASPSASSMRAKIVNIQTFSLHDGPGIRTLVFFKGCSLRCLWCDNPECINPVPEIGFYKALCDKCGKCFEVCPENVITLDKDSLPSINRERCTACGKCAIVCSPKALVTYGYDISLDDLFKEISRDAIFYSSSGGGVTVSGGEPLLQPDYVEALFKMCREANINTAMETCGNVSSEAVRKILPYVDFAFYDLKVLNEEKHLELTGKRNQQILENAHLIAESGVKVQFRMPLIPGLNDSLNGIKEMSRFLYELSPDNNLSIELMPYHRLGTGKYEALGREYKLKGFDMASTSAIELAKHHFEESGITCLVSH